MLRLVVVSVALVFSTATAVADSLQNCKQDKDQDVAIVACGDVIRADPKAVWAYDRRALAYLFKRNFDQAIADYTKAIELDPRSWSSYGGRGDAYSMKEDHDRAIADYSKSIENNPSNLVAYLIRGGAYDKSAQYNRAIIDYSTSIATNQGDLRAYRFRGDDYKRMGDQLRAAADYEAIIRLTNNATSAFSYQNRAWALLNLKRPDEALLNAQKAVELEPNNAMALDVRGRLFEVLGHRNDAISDFERALAINPHMTETADALGKLTVRP